ncbi:protein deadlock isoform X2 [Drosophila teissieri]|uniref:protein deadlock isoform X2 n=1 Tax=Drosophila teissieri TaxID=7243 RepID=UPI001CBA2264|nr:protein deadlock isoform X2 [Drosophila teissieri]
MVIVKISSKMRMRQKLACWQQILTSLGTSSMSEQEWNTIFKGFLDSWLNPYCIQTSCDPSIPLRREFLVRPRKDLQGNHTGSVATIPESAVFLEPTSSKKFPPCEVPSSIKSRDTVVNSTGSDSGNRERSSSVSNKNPGASEYAKIWKQGKRHSTVSSYKAGISKRRDSKLLSTKRRQDTCEPVGRSRESSVCAGNGNVFKCRDVSPHAPILSTIQTKDSCASPDVLVLNPKNSASKTTERRNSFSPTQDYKAPSDKIIKRRNTCVPTDNPQYLKLKTGKGQNSGDKPKNKQQPKPPPPSKRNNESKESSDDCDDQLPLSKWLLKINRDKPKALDLSHKIELTHKYCSPAPEQVKRKRGRPTHNKKAQPSRLPSLKTNFTEQGKHSAELLTIKPRSETTQAKPLRNSPKKQPKQLKQRLKRPHQKKTTLLQLQKLSKTKGKQSIHEKISQQAKNFHKASGQQKPSTSQVQRNTPPNKMRNNGVKSISAKTLMPAHMPQTAINLKCSEIHDHVQKDLGQKIDSTCGSPKYQYNVLYEHNYNMFGDEDNFRRPQDYAPNKMDVDQPLVDAIKLSSPVGGEGASVELKHDDVYDIPMGIFREVEEIDRCLENLNNKTPSEIDTQLVHTSEFFENLTRPSTADVGKSELMDLFMGGNEELDYEDDDDDVLSMAASWDGLDDELEPIEKTAEQILKPEPSTETLKPIEKEDAPQVQKIKSFRIPKLSAEDLKTHPSVMRYLYEMEELEKNSKVAVPSSLADPPFAESNRKQRDEATAARRSKEILPVFAPPYRVAPESCTNSPQFIPQVPIPTSASNLEDVNWIEEVFGIRCMQSVDNRCISFNCDHTMRSLGEVQRRLFRMHEDTLVNLYRQTIRSFFLFQTYYTSFVDIFEFRHLWKHLLIMLADCRLYKSISAPLLVHAYEALYKCGMQKEAVKCIMEYVWLPCKAHKYRDFMLMTLNILCNANWDDYCDKLMKLDQDYNFEIPQKNLITILKSSVDRSDKFSNALKLITLHPNSICTNETIMSILSSTSKSYRQNESTSASQGPPGADSGPSSIITPSAAVQPCNFRHPPIAAYNSNENHSFHFSNEYSNNKKYHD